MIDGDRVKQARELCGFTQKALAAMVGTNQSNIAHIESGRNEPSASILQGIAETTGFPEPFFSTPMKSVSQVGSFLFRARAAATSKQRNQALRYGEVLLEVAEHLSDFVDRIPVRLVQSASQDPLAAAKEVRRRIGLAPEQPIPHLTNTLEHAGVLILIIPTALQRRDAFSWWSGGADRPWPVIVVPDPSAGDRLRFSLAHELGHLIMHATDGGRAVSELEAEADRFAAAFLMPEASLKQELRSPVSLAGLVPLKERWKVSFQALIRRAYELDIIGQRQYRYLFEQLTRRGWRSHEPYEIDIERPRYLRKVVELLCPDGHYERLAPQLNLRPDFLGDLLSRYASENEVA